MALEPIQIGSVTLDPVIVLLALAGLAVLALMALAVTLIVHMKGRRREVEAQAASLPSSKDACRPSPRSASRAKATSPAPSTSGSTA